MATPSTFFNAAILTAGHVSAADNEYLRALYDYHLQMRAEGKIVFLIPRNIGAQMGKAELEDLAKKLCLLNSTPVYVHYLIDRAAYRIGPVRDMSDIEYAASNVFLTRFVPLNGATEQSSITSPQQALQGSSLPGSSESGDNNERTTSKLVKIPKPRNQWIIYRAAHHKSVLERFPNLHTSKISTIIADMWRNTSPDEKAYFQKLAEEEKARHQALYPGFRCKPRKSASIKKRKTTHKSAFHSSSGEAVEINTSTSTTGNTVIHFEAGHGYRIVQAPNIGPSYSS